jgi:cobalt/nickel transport system permease protein
MKVPKSLRDLVEGAESLVYLEDLSGKRGLLQAINPIAKLVAIVFMIVASIFISSLSYLTLICSVPLILAITSRIPLRYLVSRTLFIPAFAAIITLPLLFLTPGYPIAQMQLGSLQVIITSEGLQHMLVFSVRVWFCVASLSLLVLSTGFDKLLRLLFSLRIPPIIVQLFSLTYRYFFVSVHEAQSVLIAKEARTYVHRRTINYSALKDLGSILSTLFIRTYERSERVYMAMKSRGFEIENKNRLSLPAFRLHDFFFAATIFSAFGFLVLLL